MASLSNEDLYFELILRNVKDLVDFTELEDLIIANCKGKSVQQLKEILKVVEDIRSDLIKLREQIQQHM